MGDYYSLGKQAADAARAAYASLGQFLTEYDTTFGNTLNGPMLDAAESALKQSQDYVTAAVQSQTTRSVPSTPSHFPSEWQPFTPFPNVQDSPPNCHCAKYRPSAESQSMVHV